MKKTKKVIPICIPNDLNTIITNSFANKSKYIEYLIYQDLNSKFNDERLKKIIL